MKVRNLHILDDEGTRVLLGGTSDEGEKVSFHVVLTSDHGLKLVNMVRDGGGKSIEVDLGEINKHSPVTPFTDEADRDHPHG